MMKWGDWTTALIEATSESEALKQYHTTNDNTLALYGERTQPWGLL